MSIAWTAWLVAKQGKGRSSIDEALYDVGLSQLTSILTLPSGRIAFV